MLKPLYRFVKEIDYVKDAIYFYTEKNHFWAGWCPVNGSLSFDEVEAKSRYQKITKLNTKNPFKVVLEEYFKPF